MVWLRLWWCLVEVSGSTGSFRFDQSQRLLVGGCGAWPLPVGLAAVRRGTWCCCAAGGTFRIGCPGRPGSSLMDIGLLSGPPSKPPAKLEEALPPLLLPATGEERVWARSTLLPPPGLGRSSSLAEVEKWCWPRWWGWWCDCCCCCCCCCR